MKKVRCKKGFGTWYYKKIVPEEYEDLNGAVYELYDENKELKYVCSYYQSMIHYVKTGVGIE